MIHGAVSISRKANSNVHSMTSLGSANNVLNAQLSEAQFNLSTNLLSVVFLSLFLFGLLKTLYLTTKLASFIHLHLIHSSKLARYRRPGAWAFVTGASQGIGKALARELARNGFNVVLHGRNDVKLKHVVQELSDQHPAVSFRHAVADAATSHGMKAAIQSIAEQISQLPGPLTVLVNNIGSMHGIYGDRSPMLVVQDATATDVDAIINLNARFTAQITRALLPILAGHLSKSTQHVTPAEPFLILNLSSLVGAFGLPFMSVYSGTKGFVSRYSEALAQELALQPRLRAGECMILSTGEVTGASGITKKPSFMVPDTDTYARAALAKVGCGRLSVTSYIGHAIGVLPVELLPEWAIVMLYKVDMPQRMKWWKGREIELARRR